MIEQFHFLRPGWLLLLLPLAAWLWGLFRGRYDHANWRSVIDERLIPHVLSGGNAGRDRGMRVLFGMAALLVILAMAGPTWEKLPQPVYQAENALVIMLDLSRSMDAADIKPSRLARARHKIADILNLRTEGQTALVVYAADAFTVTPLTSDTETIVAMLPNLDSSLMPAQGSRADRAVEAALALFANAGHERGDLLLVSDGIGATELRRIETLQERYNDFRLSVLAVGTVDGGPIPLANGGFLKTADGSIVISPLLDEELRGIARAGGGVFASLSSDDLDINALTYVFESSIDAGEARRAEDRSTELWREFGPWLLLVVLPLASLAFRRGLLWLLPLWLLVVPPDAAAVDWQALWQNDDQRAERLFEQGDYAAAAQAFDDPDWRAASQYRAGDYAAALDGWSGSGDDDALYNRGNALAGLERFEDALAAYDELLERNPQHEDALFNKHAIEEFLRQREQQQQQSGQGDQQQQQQQQAGQDEQQQQSQASRQDQQQGEQQQGDTGQQDADAGQQQAGQGERLDAEQQQGPDRQAQQDSPRSSDAQSQATTGTDEQAAREDLQGEGNPHRNIDQQMSAQAAEQWLRKIPDDPGGLLRRKFLYQYRERGGVADEAETW